MAALASEALGFDSSSPREVRLQARRGSLTGQTGGLAPGFVQVNLAILPSDYADDFLRFCQRNPKPCPLLAVSEPGAPRLPELGVDLDVRTDVPSYRVFERGEASGDLGDVSSLL